MVTRGVGATVTSDTTAGSAIAAATDIVEGLAIVAVTQADIAAPSAPVAIMATLADTAEAIPVRFAAERWADSTAVLSPVADSMAAVAAMGAAADAANPVC
jgi:hypothetical protein